MMHQDNGLPQPNDSDPIHLNSIHQDIALTAASNWLTASMRKLRLSQELPQSDVMICTHALLAYQQYENGHPNGFNRTIVEAMETLSEKLVDIRESIDCIGASHVEFWMTSDEAAIDKAKELNINILPSYSMEDLRYKIHQVIHEVM